MMHMIIRPPKSWKLIFFSGQWIRYFNMSKILFTLCENAIKSDFWTFY